MRVRIHQHAKYPAWWSIEIQRWYWPVWKTIDTALGKEEALRMAKDLLEPIVEEVTK